MAENATNASHATGPGATSNSHAMGLDPAHATAPEPASAPHITGRGAARDALVVGEGVTRESVVVGENASSGSVVVGGDVTSGWFDARVVTGAHPASLLPATDPEAIAAHLDRFALSGALVSAMASWLHDPIGGNAEASAVAHDLGDRGVLACWTAVPATPGELDSLTSLVDRALDDGVAAFRIHPTSHGYSPALLDELYAALETNRLPLCVDAAEITWPDLTTIATRHPELPIVIGAVGYRKLRELWAALAANPNVYVDLVDFAAHQGVEWLAANNLAGRLVFATGLGVRDPGEGIIRLAWSGLDDATVHLVGAETAGRLFRRTAGARS